MFAFSFYDSERKKLYLCRDRLGIKPLVYYWDGKRFAFASEIKAILSDPTIPKELDYEALYLYLAFNFIPAPYTIFKGIRKLKPGHSIILENGSMKTEKYWDVPQISDDGVFTQNLSEQNEIVKNRLYETIS